MEAIARVKWALFMLTIKPPFLAGGAFVLLNESIKLMLYRQIAKLGDIDEAIS